MKNLTKFLLATSMMFIVYNTNAQEFPAIDKSVCDIANYKPFNNAGPIAKIIYSRPLKNGREIFGKLVPYGKVWRTGANESTEIQFLKDVKFGDTDIKAGIYSLFTIPSEKEWTIIINNDINAWGAYSYNKANDVARITVPASESDNSLEAFTITFTKNGTMHLGWDKTRVAVPMLF